MFFIAVCSTLFSLTKTNPDVWKWQLKDCKLSTIPIYKLTRAVTIPLDVMVCCLIFNPAELLPIRQKGCRVGRRNEGVDIDLDSAIIKKFCQVF